MYFLKNKFILVSIIWLSFFSSCAQGNQDEIKKIESQIAAQKVLLEKQTTKLKTIPDDISHLEERQIFELDSARIQQNIFELQEKLNSLIH